MGDYATRLSDGAHIKVGTCGAMYYCRYEQIDEIRMDGNYNLDGCLWRIPLPSEDGIKPGDFEYDMLLKDKSIPYELMIDLERFTNEMKESLLESVGLVQSYVESLGMLVNIPCHHGIRLPDVGDSGIKVFWNGKRRPIHLCYLKNDEKELLVGVRCSGCNHMWNTAFNEIEPYILSMEMKMRLFNQCSEYWYKHNLGPCPCEVNGTHNKRSLKMVCLAGGTYDVILEEHSVCDSVSFEDCKVMFLNLLDPR